MSNGAHLGTSFATNLDIGLNGPSDVQNDKILELQRVVTDSGPQHGEFLPNQLHVETVIALSIVLPYEQGIKPAGSHLKLVLMDVKLESSVVVHADVHADFETLKRRNFSIW